MPSGGHDYLQAMADQSRRAREFDRRLHWARMRTRLSTTSDGMAAVELSVGDIVDLQALELLRSSAAPEVPRQRG